MSQAEARTALLVMDVQEAIVERFGDTSVLGPLGRAIGAARGHGVPIIYVKIGFRSGYPEVSPSNKSFSMIRESGGFVDPQDTQVHPAVAPQAGDIVVTKKRVSAFAGSDLDVVLRAGQIGTLVLTGIATSGVVLSTLRAAADLDYRLVVLSDCCLDGDPEVHRVLLHKVFPRQAEVIDAAEWEQRLKAEAGCV
jgi:nicotinamidase-related amidase